MTAQKRLKGETYVTISLLVPYIRDLRDGLDPNHALDDLKLPSPADDLVEVVAKKAAIQCVEALVKTSTAIGGTVRASL